MGTLSFHVEGRGSEDALNPALGAGWAMSRSQAARKISRGDLQSQMKGNWLDWRFVYEIRDDAPSAYKDVRGLASTTRAPESPADSSQSRWRGLHRVVGANFSYRRSDARRFQAGSTYKRAYSQETEGPSSHLIPKWRPDVRPRSEQTPSARKQTSAGCSQRK
jgi:hypothetical protein